MGSTAKGVPYPDLTDAANGPDALQQLASWVDAHPGVSTFTYAQINALSGAELWSGRVVFQSDTGTSRPRIGPYQFVGAAWVPLGIVDYWGSFTSSSTNSDADSTWNTFNWTAVEDVDGLLTSASTLTIPAHGGGLWVFELGARWAANSAGTRQIRLVCSVAGTNLLQASGASAVGVAASRTLRLVDGETVHADRFQSSGGALALAPADGMHFFTARRVRS